MLKIDGDPHDAARKAPDHSKGTLDYTSLSEVPNLQKEMERERREALDNYNVATFGERRPIAYALMRWAGIAAVVSLILLLLPRRVADPLASVTALAFVIWERTR